MAQNVRVDSGADRLLSFNNSWSSPIIVRQIGAALLRNSHHTTIQVFVYFVLAAYFSSTGKSTKTACSNIFFQENH